MTYLTLNNLEVYKLSRKLSKIAWKIFLQLTWKGKRTVGFQFVEATDSANIAEGYGRFHFLDRKKFYFNARASLLESRHWFELIVERNLLQDKKLKEEYLSYYQKLRPALNGFINSQTKQS
ncbi:MAG: four helix bundle protein [Microgenomates group bacterium]